MVNGGPESPAGVQRRETGSSGAPLPVCRRTILQPAEETTPHQESPAVLLLLLRLLLLFLPLILLLLLPDPTPCSPCSSCSSSSPRCLHWLIVEVNDGSAWSRWSQRALKRQSGCVVSPAHPLRFTLRPPGPSHPSTSPASTPPPSQWALRSRRTRPLFFFSLLNDATSASTLGGAKLLMSGWGWGGYRYACIHTVRERAVCVCVCYKSFGCIIFLFNSCNCVCATKPFY